MYVSISDFYVKRKYESRLYNSVILYKLKKKYTDFRMM